MSFGFLGARIEVLLMSADLTRTMDALGKTGLILQNAVYVDEFQIRFTISRHQLPQLRHLIKKRGDSLEEIRHWGAIYYLKVLAKRPVLTLGLLALFVFSIWLPTRVFFVQVEGNETVAARQIIEVAGSCGIGFGASRREVRSEKIKNALLAALPQLQWAGVNTCGCRAIITVRERNQTPKVPEEMMVSSIVALRDGVVREMTVLKGNALCKPGQAVKSGEVLISAYTDCGICIQATDAQGEIFADTQRRLTAIFPTVYDKRGQVVSSGKNFSLIIGKKRINFFKGSGISGSSCAKIYEENYLTLPGGFVLPIAICTEQWFNYESSQSTAVDAETSLSDFALHYLPEQMIAGKITQGSELFFHEEAYSILEGVYGCYEMIGITRSEERLNE